MAKKAFTIDELREFRELKSKLAKVEAGLAEVSVQARELKAKIESAESERRDIRQQLSKFAELEELELFEERHDDRRIELTNPDYVTRDKKEALLSTILADFKRENPTEATISYREVKETLAKKYGVETKSITNFFLGILDKYETLGGNRNKSIVLPIR